MSKAIVIAGTVSGVGKTTISTGLMGALRRQGLKVQPFKTGPDYIDPSYHTWITGEPSRNLDTWMLSKEAVCELFNRAMVGKDIAVIEGVMGLYDGRFSTSDEGSTAELAKLLRAPVILVLDSSKGARSLAAMVKGYQSFDNSLSLAGVILNGIGSEKHLEVCRESIEHYNSVPVVGYLPRQDQLSLPERHLGLVPVVERPHNQAYLSQLTGQCLSTFDIPKILNIAEEAKPPEGNSRLFPCQNKPKRVKIGVARDKAFSFYYQDNLELLEAWGAEIVPFSPMQDTSLPAGITGLYIGGGFPEIYAAELSANQSLRQGIMEKVGLGVPVYAECGGLMYLGESLLDLKGKEYQMVGVLPISSRIDKPRLSLGYRTVQALSDGPILSEGEIVRGHEFHWSVLSCGERSANAYLLPEEDGRLEGFRHKNLLASYIHLHFGSSPALAPRFVKECERFSMIQ